MDFGSQVAENIAVKNAQNITITAETQGAKVEFMLETLPDGEYQQLPAFISPLPQSLWFVQRRKYFRISAPLHPPYYCTAQLPDNSKLRCRLYDLSLGNGSITGDCATRKLAGRNAIFAYGGQYGAMGYFPF